MQTTVMSEEKQAQFESDAAAFNGLRPGQQRTAAFLAKCTFGCRQGIVAANAFVMRGADWFYERALLAPVNALKPPAAKAWQGMTKPFRRKAPSSSQPNRLWAGIKEKFSSGLQKTSEFLERHGAHRLYRATQWAFDPRTRSGKPFFGNEKLNKVIGTGFGVCAFVALSAWEGWLEVMSKVWHAQVARHAIGSSAPWLVRLTRQAVIHPVLSVAVAAAQFLVIPSIAAARQALKSTKLAQGVAHQYNTRLRAHREEKKPAPETKTGWRPSAYVEKLCNELVEKSSPEYYKARIRHFEEKFRQKRDVKPVSLPPPVEASASKPGGIRLGKTFDIRAADPAATEASKYVPPAAKIAPPLPPPG